MPALIDTLRESGCSLVVRSSDGRVSQYCGRGVSDLYRLLTEEPATLRGAAIADKVVGRGAAALMAVGGVSQLHAETLSRQAIDILEKAMVKYTYRTLVAHVMNRAQTGWCPVEEICRGLRTPNAMFKAIGDFLAEQK